MNRKQLYFLCPKHSIISNENVCILESYFQSEKYVFIKKQKRWTRHGWESATTSNKKNVKGIWCSTLSYSMCLSFVFYLRCYQKDILTFLLCLNRFLNQDCGYMNDDKSCFHFFLSINLVKNDTQAPLYAEQQQKDHKIHMHVH